MSRHKPAKAPKKEPVEPSDIDRLAYRIWFNDIPVYDPRDGEQYEFLSLEDVENIICGPGEMWDFHRSPNRKAKG